MVWKGGGVCGDIVLRGPLSVLHGEVPVVCDVGIMLGEGCDEVCR